MENIPDTPEGIILESLLEGMNQYYSAELSQKVKRGMRETRLKGNYQGGTVPYGYKVDGKKIVIDEERAQNVRLMYELFSKGVYVKNIIQELTIRGASYNGKPFAMNTVYNILKNEKYLGVYKYGDEVIDNMYPQIISAEIFNRVRDIINSNKHGKRSVDVVYLLRHKLKCGYCGQSVIAECGTTKAGIKKYYYKCRGRKIKLNDCKKSAIPKDLLENLVLDTTIKELSKPQIVDEIVNNLLALQDKKSKANMTLNNLLKEQKQTEKALNNIVSAIEQGIISNATNKRLHELESTLQDIERRIITEKSKTAVKTTEKEIRDYYEQALKLDPQMLINYLIKEIVLYDDKIEIYYNSPMLISPDDSRGFSFYRETKIFCEIITEIILLIWA